MPRKAHRIDKYIIDSVRRGHVKANGWIVRYGIDKQIGLYDHQLNGFVPEKGQSITVGLVSNIVTTIVIDGHKIR